MSMHWERGITLVTGASSGIGRAVAIDAASRGATVALTGRNAQALERAAEEIRGRGGKCAVFPWDLADLDAIPALVSNIEATFSDSISVLVNCAGIAILGSVEDVPLEACGRNLQINFLAPMALSKAVLPSMKRRRAGFIVNLSSGVGKRGIPGNVAYCASKASLNALTECLRAELGSTGIKVLSISPGLVATEFSDRAERYGRVAAEYTEGKMLSPETVARRLLEAVEKGKRESILSMRTRLGQHLNYWAPSLLDRILARSWQPKG